jgi:NAD(P)-dependent dehydrogenase (short-subunit alcohol dehydrogenase family)
MAGRIEGRIAMITGAASGIGLASARRFSAEGATVAGFDLQKAVDDEAWNEVVAAAPDSTFQAGLDVRDEDAVAAAVRSVVERHGRIDILLNAAGVGGGAPTHELDTAEWDRVVDINLKGSFLTSKYVLAQMLEQQSGSLIHIASVEGIIAMGGALPYNVSKGGVMLMTKNQAIDYGRQGIRVNCLCPGVIDTPLTALTRDPERAFVGDQMQSWHAMDRLGQPEEVAACALFLASDDASFVTGHGLVVDGGWTAGDRIIGPDF